MNAQVVKTSPSTGRIVPTTAVGTSENTTPTGMPSSKAGSQPHHASNT
jgi:hypothetical protein